MGAVRLELCRGALMRMVAERLEGLSNDSN